MPKVYTIADSSINDELIKISSSRARAGPGETFFAGPL